MPHVDIELEDNKQFISNIPRIIHPTDYVFLSFPLDNTNWKVPVLISLSEGHLTTPEPSRVCSTNVDGIRETDVYLQSVFSQCSVGQ